MTNKHVVITIDGPAASGKSTIARALAQKFGYYYLYTGLLYRAVAYVMRNLQQEKGVIDDNIQCIQNLVYEYLPDGPHVFYQGKDITLFLYAADLDQHASIVAAHQSVREALLPIQRQIACKYNIIAEGRDCGTIVFPHADIKFFVTADLATRARRMYGDVKRLITQTTLNSLQQELKERDDRDQSRSIAPLRIPEDAIVVDTSAMTKEQAIEHLYDIVQKKLGVR